VFHRKKVTGLEAVFVTDNLMVGGDDEVVDMDSDSALEGSKDAEADGAEDDMMLVLPESQRKRARRKKPRRGRMMRGLAGRPIGCLVLQVRRDQKAERSAEMWKARRMSEEEPLSCTYQPWSLWQAEAHAQEIATLDGPVRIRQEDGFVALRFQSWQGPFCTAGTWPS